MSTFVNYSQFQNLTAHRTVYLKLTNGFFIRVTKKQIKEVATAMKNERVDFEGDIIGDGKTQVWIILKNQE